MAATKRSKVSPAKGNGSEPQGVDEFLASLDHPLWSAIVALRKAIVAAHPSITDGVKWNAPSFRTTEYFATFHLRSSDCVQVILHLGAKKRPPSGSRLSIEDPESILQWLGPDRASAKFLSLRDVQARQKAFATVIREWIKHV